MRIHGKFTDYYDYATGYYSNDNHWNRYTEKYKIKDKIFSHSYSNETNKLLYSIWNNCPDTIKGITAILGFCGKVYIINSHEYNLKYKSYINNLSKKDFNFWNYPKYIEWIQKYNNKDLTNIFLEIKSPIFIIKRPYCYCHIVESRSAYGYDFLVNPCLLDFGIQSCFGPVEAYQEIDMFIGNVLTNTTTKDINRSDDLIRDSKGFDKYSFKQRCPKKRKQK